MSARKLKIIGGYHDGRTVVIEGESIRLPTRNVVPMYQGATVKRFDEVEYTVRRFGIVPDEMVTFLAPAGWSDMQALKHQFEK